MDKKIVFQKRGRYQERDYEDGIQRKRTSGKTDSSSEKGRTEKTDKERERDDIKTEIDIDIMIKRLTNHDLFYLMIKIIEELVDRDNLKDKTKSKNRYNDDLDSHYRSVI